MRTLPVIILTTLLLGGCVAPEVLKVVPLNEDVKWRYGNQLVSKETEGVTCELTFLRTTPDYFIYQVNVVNNSNKSLLVDPGLFYIVPASEGNNSYGVIKAIDPESHLIALDKREARVKRNGPGIILLSAAGLALGASIANSDNESGYLFAEAADGLAQGFVAHSYNRQYELADIKDERNFWENKALRKTTIEPTYKVDGLVLFPRCSHCREMKLYVPLDELNFAFDFNLVKQ